MTVGSLHDPPAVVQAALARWLDVDLLPRALSNVADVQKASRAIEREAPWVPQPDRPDLLRATARREWIACRDPIRVAAVHVDSQQFAEQRVRVLGAVLWIAPRAPIAHADVEHAVRPEHHEPAVMIRIRLHDAEKQLVGRAVRAVWNGADA